jgi:hypothetical protein
MGLVSSCVAAQCLAGHALLLTVLLLGAAFVTCSTRFELSYKGDDIGQPVSSRHWGMEAGAQQCVALGF